MSQICLATFVECYSLVHSVNPAMYVVSAGNVNEKGMLVLFTTLEIILQCFPMQGPGLLQPALQQLLVVVLSGEEGNLTVTSKMLSSVLQSTGWCNWQHACPS